MGTWDTGPLDNDAAAQWCDTLDNTEVGQRVELIRRALTAAAKHDPAEYLDHDIADEAVAAATVLASLLPNGHAADYSPAPDFLPVGETIVLLNDLPRLALQALDRVDGDNSELPNLWGKDYAQVLEDRQPVRAALERAAAAS
jgi:hypothetical protein